MSYKRFSSKDLIYNVLATYPKSVFSINRGKTTYQFERRHDGSYRDENNNLNKHKHVPQGFLSLHELNINKPQNSLAYSFLIRSSNDEVLPGFASTEQLENTPIGTPMVAEYPMSSSISRIYIPDTSQGPESTNYKFYGAIKNVISYELKNSFSNLEDSRINMITVPGIFYGSKINPGSIQLDYFVTGTRIGTVQDSFSDGRLYQVSGDSVKTYTEVGLAIYNQGLLLLTESSPIVEGHQESYESNDENETTFPKWTNFGTGIQQIGTQLEHLECPDSSFQISFEGVNKIPTLTMYAYSELGDENYSHNPTFIKESRAETIRHTNSSFYQEEVDIKKINKSMYEDAEEDFKNATYISKIGIYDKHKNLIAIASLSRPVKKTEKRDYMFKIGIDF